MREADGGEESRALCRATQGSAAAAVAVRKRGARWRTIEAVAHNEMSGSKQQTERRPQRGTRDAACELRGRLPLWPFRCSLLDAIQIDV